MRCSAMQMRDYGHGCSVLMCSCIGIGNTFVLCRAHLCGIEVEARCYHPSGSVDEMLMLAGEMYRDGRAGARDEHLAVALIEETIDMRHRARRPYIEGPRTELGPGPWLLYHVGCRGFSTS